MVNNILIGSIIALASVNLVVAGAMAVGLTDNMDLTKEKYDKLYVVEDGGPSTWDSWAYIRFDGIEGGCTERDHEGWSDLVSFTHPISRSVYGTGTGRYQGRVELGDVTIVKELDKASPKLSEAICNGTHFDKVELHFTSSGDGEDRDVYYIYELENVIIDSYIVSNTGEGEDQLTEEVTINFEEVTVSYSVYDEEDDGMGTVQFNWTKEYGEIEY